MKTLKISVVATIAAMLGWLGFTQRIWPAHPQLADFLLSPVS